MILAPMFLEDAHGVELVEHHQAVLLTVGGLDVLPAEAGCGSGCRLTFVGPLLSAVRCGDVVRGAKHVFEQLGPHNVPSLVPGGREVGDGAWLEQADTLHLFDCVGGLAEAPATAQDFEAGWLSVSVLGVAGPFFRRFKMAAWRPIGISGALGSPARTCLSDHG